MNTSKNKKRTFLNIGNKLFGSVIILILVFSINAAIIFITANKISNAVTVSSEVINPSRDAINDLITLVHRSKMLITNWVYLQSNEEDKAMLKQILADEYPALKTKLNRLMDQWETDTLVNAQSAVNTKALMKDALVKLDNMLSGAEQNVINVLGTFEDYEDITTKLLAADYVDQRVVSESAELISILDEILKRQNQITAESEAKWVNSIKSLRAITLALGIGIIFFGLLLAYLLMKSITEPINYIKNIVVKMARGELIEDGHRKFSQDEIGEMAAAMDNLEKGLKATALFAENIGNGKYYSEFKALSDSDVLGNALLNMRTNLANVAENDKKRNWATEGMAKFGEILRNKNNNLQSLTDEILISLVKYLKANQGALYVIDDSSNDEVLTMSLKACYAWNRKKYMDHKIHIGEGLAGQAWQERDTIYITDVPQNYVRITSGLGEANPTSILIVPLKTNDQIFGVIELASFTLFKDFEIDFVQKIAESIASTISSVKVNARTQHLLEESQQMTEQMRAQEEEMRQNMEELQATQEEVQRSQANTEAIIKAVDASLLVVEFDKSKRIQRVNRNYLNRSGYTQENLIGEYYTRVLAPGDATHQQVWTMLDLGKEAEGDYSFRTKNGDVFIVHAHYSPVLDQSGEVVKIIMLGYQHV